ncbi:kinase-like domain-containing protein [Globomyces pollinis-pini]|nr:kinase-like domain-containing protein [Globomyces pollinis-pini]
MLHNSMKTNVQTEYKIGSLIGKGASGSVYQALSKSTGKTVAIKRIKHLSLHKLNETMSEIDLLKQLRHLNIVHLYGYERTNTDLLIIMEYCESGSLLETIKKFGNIPEILVSGYMDQVLIGLSYLHDQGIIHRDIKSANILTTKEGVVKLADFGIAMRFGIDRNVFEGSPYWMAPEVIELSGSNCSSDIWSVGCTALELYTGKPPYYDLEPISALFRIVSADTIPYPDSITPLFRDFLNECFQKDPNLRISANRLQKHPWINSFKKETNNQYIAKRVRNFSVQKILDLNVFRDVEESDDYSQDFIELENTITLKTQPIQNNEPSDPLYEISNEVMETNYSVSWTDYLAQYINSKIVKLSFI